MKMKTATLTGYALNAKGQIEMMENTRQKEDGQDGSHSVDTRWTGRTYPNTPSGIKAAQDESKRLNATVFFK